MQGQRLKAPAPPVRELSDAPGSYALVLALDVPRRLWVGRLGCFDLDRGYYVYVGSAFGPGGLRGRLSRHWSGHGRRHWHVDYLRAVSRPVAAWYQEQRLPREHVWAAALGRGRGMVGVPRFGGSDCRCETHLYYSPAMPSYRAFRRRLGSSAVGDGTVRCFQPEPSPAPGQGGPARFSQP